MKIDAAKLRVNFAIGATHAAELQFNFNPHNKVQCKHNTGSLRVGSRPRGVARRAPVAALPRPSRDPLANSFALLRFQTSPRETAQLLSLRHDVSCLRNFDRAPPSDYDTSHYYWCLFCRRLDIFEELQIWAIYMETKWL